MIYWRVGWSEDPLDPDNYHKDINDFEANPERQVTVNKEELIKNLDRQIRKLKNED